MAEHKVAAVSVHFADGRVEVVQIAFHYFERSVVRATVLATAVTPAGEVLPHVVGGDDMFPFDAFSSLETFAFFIFAGLEIATAEIDSLFVDVPAIAVERPLEVSVIDASHLFARIAVVVVLWGCFGIHLRERECRENAKNQSDSAC